uniref:Uncharacterized protein n=1 Tax=Trypanosoma vivax (strain Y486) TaxID=1055687 RepID=G0U333_TRYVY|nr:hypothetical protein TVY486_0905090 [Trypanosoma vivax Y486]
MHMRRNVVEKVKLAWYIGCAILQPLREEKKGNEAKHAAEGCCCRDRVTLPHSRLPYCLLPYTAINAAQEVDLMSFEVFIQLAIPRKANCLPFNAYFSECPRMPLCVPLLDIPPRCPFEFEKKKDVSGGWRKREGRGKKKDYALFNCRRFLFPETFDVLSFVRFCYCNLIASVIRCEQHTRTSNIDCNKVARRIWIRSCSFRQTHPVGTVFCPFCVGILGLDW